VAHTMNASVWECDWWTTSVEGQSFKCTTSKITTDVYTDVLPEGWTGVVLTSSTSGDSEYMLVCPKHGEWLVDHFGGSWVVFS